jgi:magnesium chelatase family protein
MLQKAVTNMNLSARSYYRVLKLARTIADLADREEIIMQDIAEALSYRKTRD